jgi:hypothetical protein
LANFIKSSAVNGLAAGDKLVRGSLQLEGVKNDYKMEIDRLGLGKMDGWSGWKDECS